MTIGRNVFHVQIVATEALREHGLMGVRTLPADRGMLFLWDDVAARHFYMKDTLIPLDLHFAGGRVKLAIGLAKGKRQFEKRDVEQKRDWKREQSRLLKQRTR